MVAVSLRETKHTAPALTRFPMRHARRNAAPADPSPRGEFGPTSLDSVAPLWLAGHSGVFFTRFIVIRLLYCCK